ncbi:arylamine N-acetyltransferase family protein [Paenibacillus kandeliae]|uniref:arylamine N-acetyltransferase family protein n=1 Tax=Paenibacillus kandeliae TaxID=3231269 RepID=UPI003457D14D
MKEIISLFEKRLHMNEGALADESMRLEQLNELLEQMALVLPFENRRVLTEDAYRVDRDSLLERLLLHRSGGLCYELNTLLYYVLSAKGMDVSLVQGQVYDAALGDWLSMGNSHILIILQLNEQQYLVDNGFGIRLPLRAVPLHGNPVVSRNGEFRISTEDGYCILQQKQLHQSPDWQICYRFRLDDVIDESVVNDIQQLVRQHPDSKFNKSVLITRCTDTGSMTLTDHSYTVVNHGDIQKEPIDDQQFAVLVRDTFQLDV